MSKTLYSAPEISTRVAELGRSIAAQTPEGPLVYVCVLKGAFIFMADLIRATPREVACDFVSVSSYGESTRSSGTPTLTKDLSTEIRGRHVVIVEDIVDTGLTSRLLLNHFAQRSPATLCLCTLLDKPSRRRVDVQPDYVGFTIENLFVVGYGLDFAEQYRNLPFLSHLENGAA